MGWGLEANTIIMNLLSIIDIAIKKKYTWKFTNISLQTSRTPWQDMKVEVPLPKAPKEIIIAMDNSSGSVAHHIPLPGYNFRMTNGLGLSDSYMFSYDCFWDYDQSTKKLISHVITARMNDNMEPMLFNKVYYR